MINQKRKIQNDVLFSNVQALFEQGCSVKLTVIGFSMTPFLLNNRDKFILSPLKDKKLKKGMILLVQLPDKKFVLHRLIKLDGNQLTLMGDGNCDIYEIVSADAIIGFVESVVRKGKIIGYDSFYWRFFSYFWSLLLPIRKPLLKLFWMQRNLKRRIKKQLK